LKHTNSDILNSLFPAAENLGFDEGFAASLGELGEPDCLPARVTAVHRGSYRVLLPAEIPGGGCGLVEREAHASGRLLHLAGSPAELPAVGDWAAARLDRSAGNGGAGEAAVTLLALLPRRSAFARKEAGLRPKAQVLAANVDTAFIVCAAGHDWNPRRIERFLALAWEAGVNPVIVITKADIASDPVALVAEAETLSFGTPVALVCAPEGRGLDALEGFLQPGRTVVLLGSSGAGKSTLLNALAGVEVASTGPVRVDDERGRHTTTHRELFALPSGALVIDTPGLREVQLWASEEAVDAAYEEVEALAAECRFRDCSHEAEPGCAVRAALETGELDPGRYAGWKKLRREVAFLERKDDVNLARAEADRWRAINKSMRGYSKERRSIQGSAR
jgi:ribosome biogenesis GTPase